MRTSKEGPHKAKVFWQKAGRYSHAAHANLDAGDFDPAISNAVNAVINVVDALGVLHRGERSTGENHHEAICLLNSLTTLDPSLRDKLGKRLTALLSVKGLAQYEGVLATRRDAEHAVQDMDRALAAVEAVANEHGW